MADKETEQRRPDEEPSTFSEWVEIAKNRIKRWPIIIRLRFGRKKVGDRPVPVRYELEQDGWIRLNQNLFGTNLSTVEKFWTAQQKLYGHGGDKGYLDGNPEGIVAVYKNLGLYFDIDRIPSEVKWFEVGTNYQEEDVSFEIPEDEKEWRKHNWDVNTVRTLLLDKSQPWKQNKYKRITLGRGVVYHEGKKEYRENLYMLGHDNIKKLNMAFANFNKQYNLLGLQEALIPVEIRTKFTNLSDAMQDLFKEIQKIETDEFTSLNNLSGIVSQYNNLRNILLTSSGYRPETAGVGTVRFEHTYRIISQFKTVEIEEEIVEKDERGRKKGSRKRKRDVIMYLDYAETLKMYEEEENEIKLQIGNLKNEISVEVDKRKEKISNIRNLIANKDNFKNELVQVMQREENNLRRIIESNEDKEDKLKLINGTLRHPDKLIDDIIEDLINLSKGQILKILEENIPTDEKLSRINSALLESLKATSIIENLVISRASHIKSAFTPFILDENDREIPKTEDDVYTDLQDALQHSKIIDDILKNIFSENEQAIRGMITLDKRILNVDEAYKVLKTLILQESKNFEDEIAQIKVNQEKEGDLLKDIEKQYREKYSRLRSRLAEIGNIEKVSILEDLKPKLGNFYQRREEKFGLGLDENGYPLEINPSTGEILIDKWWRELAQNKWQLERIASKAGGAEMLKMHLELNVDLSKPEGERVPSDWQTKWKRDQRVFKDDRFYGYVDLMEMGSMIYSYWDSFRDDLRDGRYHPHSKSIGDYVIEGEGGFSPIKGAPYIRSWKPGLGRIGIFFPRGKIPKKETGIDKTKQDLIKATPADFENVPEDEKNVMREFRMRISDTEFYPKDSNSSDSKTWAKRKPTKYNPAFDRRARDLDYVFWGNMYYYRWVGNITEWSENPFPHISTRGLAHYLFYRAATDVWNYTDAEKALEGLEMDYGVRGSEEFGVVNPASGIGILQEN